MTTATAIHAGARRTTAPTCDRCIARAAFLAHLPGGGELMFCGHHHRIHAERLRATGALVWPLPVVADRDAA